MAALHIRSISLGLVALIFLASASTCQAGHDLFTQLVISEQSDTGLDRLQSPISIGLPLPDTSEIQDVDKLVLVGSLETQYQIKNRWPNGAIRWILIDALVDLPNEDEAMTLQLTTGQAPPVAESIARESDDRIFFDTGLVQFEIPKEGPGILSQIVVVDQRLLNDIPFSLALGIESIHSISSQPRILKLEQNGPVKAVASIESTISRGENQLIIVTYLTAFHHQSQIEMEISSIAAPSNSTPIELPSISMTVPLVEVTEQAVPSDREEGHFTLSAPEGNRQILLALESATVATPPILQKETSYHSLTTHLSTLLAPGAIRRSQIRLDIAPTSTSSKTISSPLIGRATSIETYNDSLAFHDKLHPAEESTKNQTESRFHRYLRAIDASFVSHYQPARAQLEERWSGGIETNAYPGEEAAVWPLATGDLSLEKAYLLWGQIFLKNVNESPTSYQSAAALHHLADLYAMTNDPAFRTAIWLLLESWLLPLQGEASDRIKAAPNNQGTLLSAITTIIQLGGFSPEKEDQLYDLLETLLVLTPQDKRGERWFYEAYLITGDPERIREGQSFLDDHPQEPSKNLAHLIKAPLRYRIWKSLEIPPSDTSNSQGRHQWTVPNRAERYRFKIAPEPMTLSLREAKPNRHPFHEGLNMSDEPVPGAVGTSQSYSIPPRFKSNPDLPMHLAGKYLERGAALPAPQPPDTTASELPTENETSPWAPTFRLLQTAGVAISLAIILMWWKRKKTLKNASLLVLLLSMATVSCQPPAIEETTESLKAVPRVRETTTTEGSYHVSYHPTPSPIPLNDHFAIQVQVTPQTGVLKPIEIEVNADMPAHGHGINTTPTVKNDGSGQFRVEGILFHMKGDWELYVDILDGPVRERAVFPITL